jgi:23S rRNA (guanosine2251-2'-O)-methyltransferase
MDMGSKSCRKTLRSLCYAFEHNLAVKKLKLEELGRLSVDAFKEAEKLPLCFVLDNVRSMHNVGSAFRTADAFRISRIYLTGITAQPPHREIEKTALGATSSVDWKYYESTAVLLHELKRDGWKIAVVEQTTDSIPLHHVPVEPAGKVCLVFGNEINGVSEEALPLADMAIEIPQAGTKHSLNISVCVGIVAWHFYSHVAGG